MPFERIARFIPWGGALMPRPDASKLGYAALLMGAGLLLASTALSANEQSAKQWLNKMSAAMQELSYQGVFVYRRDDDMAAMKVTHIVDENGARELLETLTGEARREVRSSAAGRHGAAAVPQLKQIEDFYELKVLGTDRTAGQPTKMISVIPRDDYRYGYRLWLDQASGLLLKSDLLAGKDTILEQVMFTSVDLLSPDDLAAVAPHHPGDSGHPHDQSAEQEVPWQWQITDLPGGFELLESQPVAQHPGIRHVVYSDGLASVSVFVEPVDAEGETFVGLSRMGAVNAFGRVEDGYQVTVVGEVPAVTVKTIGESIQRKGGTQ